MLKILIFASLLRFFVCDANAQQFKNYNDYCRAMVQTSIPTLVAKNNGYSKSDLQAQMAGMTDPQSIRFLDEVIDFAFSKPNESSVNEMAADLYALCVSKSIFAQ